ncbi:hypothetical protein BC833DRAFT_590668 [Globomyces pollinis-pini]|nr:hypothetical protein BC833DRAFT_590668 [Globomyces pollinis-pini]
MEVNTSFAILVLFGNPITQNLINIIHFYLMQSFNSRAITLIFTLSILSLPFYIKGLGFVGGGPYFLILVRLSAMCMVPHTESTCKKLRDYMYFWYTFDTIKNRALFRIQCRKRNDQMAGKYLARTVYHIKSQSKSYYFQLLQTFAWDLFWICFSTTYFNYYAHDWEPKSWTMFDITDRQSLNYILFGLGLLSFIRMSHTIYGHCYAALFDLPFQHSMQNPYMATSIGDFWANRWNLAVQPFLKMAVYNPILKLFGYDLKQNPNRKPPYILTLMAVVGTFAFSGITHEWLLLLIGIQSTGEQLAFFLLHAALVFLETFVVSAVYKATGFHLLRRLPSVILWIYTYSVILWTAPLVFGTYVRGHDYSDIVNLLTYMRNIL